MFETWEVLPYWLYLNAILSGLRTLQCYTPSLAQRLMGILYPGVPFHQERRAASLAARQFGCWHMLSAIVQINAGMHPHDYGAYNVAAWSFVIILLHFLWERLGMVTLRGQSFLAAEAIAFVSFCWMMIQKGTYMQLGETRFEGSQEHMFEGQAYIPGAH